MDTGNVDMAKTMAEVFSIGDINKDEKLSKVEFVQNVMPCFGICAVHHIRIESRQIEVSFGRLTVVTLHTVGLQDGGDGCAEDFYGLSSCAL